MRSDRWRPPDRGGACTETNRLRAEAPLRSLGQAHPEPGARTATLLGREHAMDNGRLGSEPHDAAASPTA